MELLCGYPTNDGTPCTRKVQREGQLCQMHMRKDFARKHRFPLKSGRYSKNLPKDIAERVRELLARTEDTREEEALIRWMIGEYLEAYEEGQVSLDKLYLAINGGTNTLSKAAERREKLELMKKRSYTPEHFITLVAVLGDIVQKRVSDSRERQLVAADFAALLRGQTKIIETPNYPHPRLAADAEPVEIISDALAVT